MKHQLTKRVKIAALILPAILTAGLMQAQAPASAVAPQTFIASVAPMAQASQRVYKVPASVSIAQAILESGWGESGLTKRANNYFGIKCSQWRSQYQTGCISMNTWEVYSGANVYINAAFRTYASGEDSFKDHGNFFHVNSRYAPAFSTTTADDFARAIHRAGYATDPNYANKLIGLMNDYGLRRYDNISTPAKPAAPKYAIVGGIGATYYNLDSNVRSRLGEPTANEQAINGGWKQNFNGGSIYYSVATGGHVVWGAVGDNYDANGGSDVFGLPTRSEYKVGNSWAQDFTNGKVVLSESGDVATIMQPFAKAVDDNGGLAKLGLPQGNKKDLGGGRWVQKFANADIYVDGDDVSVSRGKLSEIIASNKYGKPTGPATQVGDGFAQPFASGTLMGNDTLGYWLIPTELLPTYQENSTTLGLPVAEAMTTETQISQNYENGTLAITR